MRWVGGGSPKAEINNARLGAGGSGAAQNDAVAVYLHGKIDFSTLVFEF